MIMKEVVSVIFDTTFFNAIFSLLKEMKNLKHKQN